MIEINNLGSGRASKESLKRVSEVVLKGEKSKISLSIVLLGSGAIKKLNRKYRKKNKPTDVLSFQYGGEGEIAICLFEVKRNAKRFKSTFKKELKRVLIHGILHLFGYDHDKSEKEAKKMIEKENYYLKILA